MARLGFAWDYDTHTNRGLEATPIVVDGVMYTSGSGGQAYALDARTGKELFDLLYRLNGQTGITFVIATHDKGISGRCRRVVSMTDGRIDVTENGLAPLTTEI